MNQDVINKTIREAMTGLYNNASIFLIVFSLINIIFVAKDLFTEYTHKKKVTKNIIVFVFLVIQTLVLLWARFNSGLFFDVKLAALLLITLTTNIFICTKNIIFSKVTQLFIFFDLILFLLIGTFIVTPIVYEQYLFKGDICFGISCPIKQVVSLNTQLDTLQKKYDSLKDIYSGAELLVTDRQGKEWKKYVSNSGIPFTLLYPTNWKVESSVFVDEKGNKVAEFSPGMEEMKVNKSCFEEKMYRTSNELGTVKQNTVTIGRYLGELQITKVEYEGGSPNWNGIWYPNSYCLKEGDKAFYMTFYEYTEKPTQQKLYEQILTTLKILE